MSGRLKLEDGTTCINYLKDLNQQELKRWLLYDPETGLFTRKVKRGGHPAGEIAGTSHPDGYWQIKINGKFYLAHRLAWLWVYGRFPENFIDHIDLDRLNNKIKNLRECFYSENVQNTPLRKDNTSGIKGITWHKASRKWRARITLNGKRYNLGNYEDIELAELVVNEAREKLHGSFCRYK